MEVLSPLLFLGFYLLLQQVPNILKLNYYVSVAFVLVFDIYTFPVFHSRVLTWLKRRHTVRTWIS